MITSALVTGTSKENDVALELILYLYYLIWFKKNDIQAWIESSNKVNAMTLAYISKLGLWVYRTNDRAQKIDGSTLKIFEIVLTSFQVEEKVRRVRFFQKTFLLTNISMGIILSMPFLMLSNANVQFVDIKLSWGFYITTKALPTTKQIELINKKKFAKTILDENFETFVIYVASFNLALRISPNRAAQIASLLAKKVMISDKYLDFANIFLEEKTLVLPEHTKLSEYIISLDNSKQPSYGPIYSLFPIKLKTIKTYNETYLKTGFI